MTIVKNNFWFSLLIAISVGGCQAGPYRVSEGQTTFYAQSISYSPFSSIGHGVDEVTGFSFSVAPGELVEHVDQAEFDAITSKLIKERLEKAAITKKQLDEDEQYRAQKMDDESRIRRAVYEKDWNRWYNFYISSGYTPEEARFKTNQVVRP